MTCLRQGPAIGIRAQLAAAIGVFALVWPWQLLEAQTTLNGTHCVIFDPLTRGEFVRCVARTTENHVLTIALVGTGPNQVREIALSLDGREPFQRLPVKALPLITPTDVGLLYLDMNFDSEPDIAVMESPNQRKFFYFLFNRETKRFEVNDALAQLSSPRFDADAKRVYARSIDSRGGNALDTYVWEGTHLELLSRRVKVVGKDGCLEEQYERRDGKLELLRAGRCR